MKKLKSNKRGIAIESAVFFMVVLFSLSFLITSIALSVAYRIKANDTLLDSRLKLDQAAEYMVKSGNSEQLPEGYSCEKELKSNGEGEVTVCEIKKDGKHLLTVELNEENEVIKWTYK
jgi:hypothetical protein